MHHAVVIEPDAALRALIRQRMAALGESIRVAADAAGARLALLECHRRARVVARGKADPASVAALQAALPRAPQLPVWRIVVIDTGCASVPDTRAANAYLLELDRLFAADWLQMRDVAPRGPWAQFDHLERLPDAGSLQRHRVRDRVGGDERLVVQGPAGCADMAAACEAHSREARPWVDLLRHEIDEGFGWLVMPPPACEGGATLRAEAA